jgi:hypothetical protein
VRVLCQGRNTRRCVLYETTHTLDLAQDKRHMPMNRDRSYTPLPPAKPKPKPPVTKVPAGKAEPWAYGPFRIVAQRRVTEEEQLSVECYATTVEQARAYLAAFLADFRHHNQVFNEQVVLVQQQQLDRINQMIEERGEEARRIERDVAALLARKQDLAAATPEEPANADDSA